MRIDYSEPRKSYTSTSSGPVNMRSSGSSSKTSFTVILLAASLFVFGTGFLSGWLYGKSSEKKAYRAAMEQKSLENSPKEEKKGFPQQQQPVPPPVTGAVSQPQSVPQQPAAQVPGNPQEPTTPSVSVPTDKPLTFYKNLPSGQKNTVLGSGINEKPKPSVPALQSSSQTSNPALSQTSKKTEQAAALAKPPVNTGGYVVQVASYRSIEDAKKLKKELTEKGYTDVSVSEVNLNENGTWHRVRIGRHLDKEAAIKIANKLLSSAKVQPDTE